MAPAIDIRPRLSRRSFLTVTGAAAAAAATRDISFPAIVRAEESIRIGENIVVRVVKIKGGSVRLGIEAPKDIEVVREELDDDPGGMDNRK